MFSSASDFSPDLIFAWMRWKSATSECTPFAASKMNFFAFSGWSSFNRHFPRNIIDFDQKSPWGSGTACWIAPSSLIILAQSPFSKTSRYTFHSGANANDLEVESESIPKKTRAALIKFSISNKNKERKVHSGDDPAWTQDAKTVPQSFIWGK